MKHIIIIIIIIIIITNILNKALRTYYVLRK